MGSGCGNIIVDIHPSSSGQLPVPVALNAGLPTLLPFMIHEHPEKVKQIYQFLEISFFADSLSYFSNFY